MKYKYKGSLYSFHYLLDFLFVGVFLIFIGINRYKIYKPLFNKLILLGLVAIFYHIYKIKLYSRYLNAGKGKT